jgi:competence protein ComEA
MLVLPGILRSARLGVRSRALVGLAAVLALAVVVFGVRVAWARAESRPTVVAPGAGERSSALQRGSDPAPGLVPTGATTAVRPGGQVVVHVVGRVRHPGLVTLAAGSRVADAITASGGALPGADLSAVNLARLLVDGEQIHVPKPGEAVPQAPGGAAGPSGSAGGLVNLNTADLATLDTLPGVGPVLAQRILDWRAEHGRFSRVDELGEVSGIGDKLLAQLTPKVTV